MSANLAHVGGPIAAGGLALLLLTTRRDLRLAGLGLWALGGLMLVPLLAPSGHRPLLGAAAVFGLAFCAGLAVVFRRWPWLLPLAVLAAVPARVPVHVGSTEANLLIPMYAVVVAAALLLAWELWHGDVRGGELGPIALPLAALVGWIGLSLAWSDDVREGAIELAFFVLPFGLLTLVLARFAWSRPVIVRLYALLAAMALVFAAVGMYQWGTRDLFWNPKVITGNAYHTELFFRVNSVFWDPSIYGRFLVVAILATLVILLFGARRERFIGGAVGIAFVWLGLLVSFSQSSFAALFAGTLIAAAFVWRWRTAVVLGGAVVAVLAIALVVPTSRDSVVHQSKKGLDHATSGRWGQVTTGLHIAGDHPLWGVGVGSFKRAYAEKTGVRGKEPKKGASHNTPVTMAAETGIPGVLLLGWLLVAALLAAFRRAGPSFEGRTALIAGVSLGAIAVHSLFYNAFFEDPTTWGLLALAAVAAVGAGAGAPPGEEAPVSDTPTPPVPVEAQ